MKDKATSFFFTKFPDSWDTGALWKMFKLYENVVDVYLAFKRTKLDTRFGFVRFINVGNVNSFEKKLKDIMISGVKLIINRAKFVKVRGKGVPVFNGPLNREAVIGSKYKGDLIDNLDAHENGFPPLENCIFLEEDRDLRSNLERYITTKILEENKVWLQHWFDDLKLWRDKDEHVGRLVWINCEGISALARNSKAVINIAKEVGTVMEIEKLDFNCYSLHPEKALVFTPEMKDINRVIKVLLNGVVYPVRRLVPKRVLANDYNKNI
ncbi:nucleotide-binding alpha-beta plait domain-containing protein [Tanacetum coccineum]